jgi:hypothetical protein
MQYDKPTALDVLKAHRCLVEVLWLKVQCTTHTVVSVWGEGEGENVHEKLFYWSFKVIKC